MWLLQQSAALLLFLNPLFEQASHHRMRAVMATLAKLPEEEFATPNYSRDLGQKPFGHDSSLEQPSLSDED